MSKENFNPNDIVSRALLLMKYDNRKTLTENVETLDEINQQMGWFEMVDGTVKQMPIKGNTFKRVRDAAGKAVSAKSDLKIAQQIANDAKAAADAAAKAAANATGGAASVVVNNNGIGGGAAAAAPPVTNAASMGASVIQSWSKFGAFMLSPLGVGVLVGLSYWLYTVNRSAGNEEKLRNAVKACKIVESKGQRKKLQSEGALKDSARDKAALLYKEAIENSSIEQKGFDWSFGQGFGTDEAKIVKANKLIQNGNMADLCIIMMKYEQMNDEGHDFAQDMAADLNEGELAGVISIMQNMLDPYSGGGVKVIPEDSLSKAYYKEKYGCVFQTKDTFVSGPKPDPDGFSYIVIKGSLRQKSNGTTYNRLYRLYADGDRLQLADPNNPKPTNATFDCDGNTPIAVISDGGDVNESLYESYLRKTRINEVFDDRGVKAVNVDVAQEDLEGWEKGLKVATWPVWLKKYPCLKLKFPTGKPLLDNMSYSYFINLNPKNNKNYRFYSDGEIWDAEGAKFIGKRWSCSLRGDTVLVESRRNIMEQIPFDIEGETDLVPSGSTTTSGNTPNVDPNTEQITRPCLDFPITRGCYGRVIGDIQSALGMKLIDAKFGKDTYAALVKYGAKDGILTKEIYDKIMAEFKAKQGNSGGTTGGNAGGTTGGNNNLVAPNPDELKNVDPSVG